MSSETGISIYFRDNRIHIRQKTIHDLGKPEYIHLLINEEKKQMFIQSCERDRDAFRLYYSDEEDNRAQTCYINAKAFLIYLSGVIGVEPGSDSLWYSGKLLADGKTVYIDLREYRKIPYEGTR